MTRGLGRFEHRIGFRVGLRSAFIEEVLVNLLECIRFLRDYATVMVNHECGQIGSVNENEACVDPVGVVSCLFAEAACCDEHATRCLSAVQCSDKCLDVWPPNMTICVALRLYVNHVQTELVKPD